MLYVTVITPYSQMELVRPKSATPRISWVEYLAATYPDEWENFARMIIKSGDTAGKVLLDKFLNTPIYGIFHSISFFLWC